MGGARWDLGSKDHCIPQPFCLAQQTSAHQTRMFMEKFSPLKSQTTTSKYSLLSLAKDDIQGEGFGHVGKLFSSPESLPYIHVIKLCLILLC